MNQDDIPCIKIPYPKEKDLHKDVIPISIRPAGNTAEIVAVGDLPAAPRANTCPN